MSDSNPKDDEYDEVNVDDVIQDTADKKTSMRSSIKDQGTGLEFSIHASPRSKGAAAEERTLTQLNPKYRLVAEEDAQQWSMLSVRLAVLASACGLTILRPNFPFLVTPGGSEYSFPSTSPFDFSAATYFLPMTAQLGTAITSAFVGSLSDRIGRRPCILLCMLGSTATLIVQYFARTTFWGFCAASFVNGLFGSAIPVAMAYASDVCPTRVKKDAEIGALIGFNMIGMSGGGVIAILMEDQDLFAPLFVAAGMDFLALVFCYFVMIEPGKDIHANHSDDDDQTVVEEDGPEKINWLIFSNVIGGALFDNIGSSGLYPLVLAPLAFNNFFMDFVMMGQEPIMSATAYKWISVCVAFMVIPGAAMSQPVYARIGAAGGCVMGNAITAIGIVACMLIAEIDPPTDGTFAGFLTTLYLIFPLTVISQLSTGPMLDMLAPADQRGFAQGVNMTVMNFSMAVSPWVLGIMSDNWGTVETLWFCAGLSVLASVVNFPLTRFKELKRKPPTNYQQAMGLEDQDLVDRAVKGEWVPAKFIDDLNYTRIQKGLPFLRVPVREYAEDKQNLKVLKRHAKEDFEYHRFVFHDVLNDLAEEGGKERNAAMLLKGIPSQENRDNDAEAIGRWYCEYMKDSGYFLDGGWPPVYKQMIMQAFPPINTDGEINANNIEQTLLKTLANMNRFLREEGQSRANKGFRNSVVV